MPGYYSGAWLPAKGTPAASLSKARRRWPGDIAPAPWGLDDPGLLGQTVHGVRAIQAGQVPELVASFDSIALGSACDIATGPGEQVHVVFHDSTHPSIWYARWDGAWQVELIEGMGFNVGGRVRGPLAITAMGPMDAADIGLTVDDAGRARACFFRSGRLIVY